MPSDLSLCHRARHCTSPPRGQPAASEGLQVSYIHILGPCRYYRFWKRRPPPPTVAETALAQPESQRDSPKGLDSSRHVRSQSAAFVRPKLRPQLRPQLPPSTLGASLERTKAAKAAAAKVAAAKVAVAMHARALVSLSPATLPPPPAPPLAPSSSAVVGAAKLAWPKNQSEYYNNHNGSTGPSRPCAYTEQRDCHNGNNHNTEDGGMATTSTDEQPSAAEVQPRPQWRCPHTQALALALALAQP